LRNFVVSLDQRHQRLRLTRDGSSTIDLGPVHAPTPAVAGPAQTRPNDATNINDYVGTYGDRTLTVVDGKLTIQRPGGRPLDLVAVGRDAFSIVGIPAAKIEFGRDGAGKVSEIRVLNQQNQWESARRDSLQKQ
jgi:hypothetical protein